jgi:hypothetical protein
VNAAQLTQKTAEIPIRITGRTTPEAQSLVCEFWRRLGYAPVVELDAAEALLR